MTTTHLRRRLAALAAALLSTVLVLSACGNKSDESTSSAPTGSTTGTYPVTVTSDLGKITLTKKPEKIMVLGDVKAADVLAALGEEASILGTGFNNEKTTLEYYPWLKGRYGKYVAGLSGTFENGVYDLDAEAIATQKPDLIILATLGSLKESTRKSLSEVAPLYALDDPKNWTQIVTDLGALTGKSEEAKQVISKERADFSAARESIANLQGKTFYAGFVNPDGSVMAYPEMSLFLEQLGLEHADNMPVLPDRGKPISTENRDKITADIVFLGSVDGDYKKLQSDPRYTSLPAVKNGTMGLLETLGVSPDAMTQIGPTQIPWVLEKILPMLEKSALNTER